VSLSIAERWEPVSQTRRRLRRDWPFTAAFVVTLALGLAANLAVFSAIDAYFLRPLPYPHARRLVDLYLQTAKFPLTPGADMSAAGYQQLRGVSALSTAGLLSDWGELTVSVSGEPSANEPAVAVTASLLQTLDVPPLLGRWISPAADRTGGPPEADLSYGFWQSAFRGDPHVLGRTLRISGGPLITVVGVMPPDFAFPQRQTQLWVGLPLAPDMLTAKNGALAYVMIARLNSGASRAELDTELDGALARLEHAMPVGMHQGYQQVGAYFTYLPLREWLGGATRGRLLMMQLGAGILLLLAVASLANLALARALRRRDESALRVVLGAGPRQLLTQAFLEAVPLGAAAVLIAWPLTELGIRALAHYGVASIGAAFTLHVGAPLWVLAFVVALLLSSAALALPQAFVVVERPAELLYGTGKGSSSGHRVRPLRLALSVGQIGLAIALLAGALLIGRSLENMIDSDPGFASRQLYAAMVLLQGPRSEEWGPWLEAHRRLEAAVAALHGVRESGIGEAVPFSSRGTISGFTPVQDRTGSAAKALGAITLAGPGLMQTLGVHLLAGRLLDESDAATDAANVVIDQRLADRLFGDSKVIGRTLNCDLGTCSIVGVIGTIQDAFTRHYSFSNGAVFAPEEPRTFKANWERGGNTAILMRSSEPPAVLVRELRDVVHRTLPDQSLIAVVPMQELISDAAQGTAALASLLIAFGLLAFTLAIIGTYGVLAYMTGLRRRELAVRQVVGAEPVQIESLVLGQGVVLWLLGTLLGVGCALVFARSLAGQLYQVSLYSPATYVLPALVVGAAVMLASWIPARGARKLDLVAQIRPE
jgi:putative ABC transport system permease protein